MIDEKETNVKPDFIEEETAKERKNFQRNNPQSLGRVSGDGASYFMFDYGETLEE